MFTTALLTLPTSAHSCSSLNTGLTHQMKSALMVDYIMTLLTAAGHCC